MKIIVVYGGKSAEHDISILTAFSIIKEIYFDYYEVQPVYINRKGEWLKGEPLTGPVAFSEALRLEASQEAHFATSEGEVSTGVLVTPYDLKEEECVVFPVLHGPNGEDGTIQGLFEMMDVPYVGCGVLASACGMDKITSKQLFQQAGLPQLPYVPFNKTQWKQNPESIYNKIEGTLIYPVFVKPANMGSSVGISKADDRESLKEAINEAARFDSRLMIEEGIEMREIEISVMGNNDLFVSLPGEILSAQAFYDYETKYHNTESKTQVPANLDEDTIANLQMIAKKVYKALDLAGLSRVDFFIEKNTNQIYFNEVNTLPGFTDISMYAQMWQASGIEMGMLIEELINLAFKRRSDLNRNEIQA